MEKIEIRPLRKEELDHLESMNMGWPFGRPRSLHVERLNTQRLGEAVYLVAWHGEDPVGHVLLRWHGKPGELAASPTECPRISDLFVVPRYQSHGIGTHLMELCEGMARKRGYRKIGLNVATDNLRARYLYERRGYVDSGLGEVPARWSYIDSNGKEHTREEKVLFMVKALD